MQMLLSRLTPTVFISPHTSPSPNCGGSSSANPTKLRTSARRRRDVAYFTAALCAARRATRSLDHLVGTAEHIADGLRRTRIESDWHSSGGETALQSCAGYHRGRASPRVARLAAI